MLLHAKNRFSDVLQHNIVRAFFTVHMLLYAHA